MNNYTALALMMFITLIIAAFIVIITHWLSEKLYKKSKKLDEIYSNDLKRDVEEEEH